MVMAMLMASFADHVFFDGYSNAISEPVNIEKSNVLLLGPTGSGKTLIAKRWIRENKKASLCLNP